MSLRFFPLKFNIINQPNSVEKYSNEHNDSFGYFIVFRRRDGGKDEYIEDLRVRRDFITGILKLLTLKGNWRAHQGEEPLNKWYTGSDWLSDLEIEEAFPDDDIPEGVHFETLDDDCNSNLSFTLDVFLCWLTEGRYHCAVAQDLLRLWTYTLAGSKHDATNGTKTPRVLGVIFYNPQPPWGNFS